MGNPAASHAHVCVWIDHREAKLFGIGLDTVDEEVLREPGPHRHLHRKADHVGQGKAPPDRDFLNSIAEALFGAKAILILGPGDAKTELAGHLTLNFPAIAKRVWGIEPADHPTDREIVAKARHFFHATDRLRA